MIDKVDAYLNTHPLFFSQEGTYYLPKYRSDVLRFF